MSPAIGFCVQEGSLVELIRLCGGADAATILSPMPGKIVRVLVAAGQNVTSGEPLVVLEAMKMEHTMKAPNDAVIKGVHAAEGDVVGQRAVLLSFE